MSNKKTTVAIAYDFDGTLARGNIQENSFIPKLEISNEKFWSEVKRIAKKEEMDEILAYMYLIIDKARAQKEQIDKKSIMQHGNNANFFTGVKLFFSRLNEYASKKHVSLEHYIISSGTKEMIEGTSIARNFKYIYASSFKYDQHGVAEWPALAINYTTKTQYLFRINKGILDAWDNSKINDYTPKEKRLVPFKHIIYIGDGSTDIPAMKMVNYQGGHSIAVYPPYTRGARDKVLELLNQDRVHYIAPADYSANREIDKIIKAIIDKISADAVLQKFHDAARKSAIQLQQKRKGADPDNGEDLSKK